jgi:hypothetical protein
VLEETVGVRKRKKEPVEDFVKSRVCVIKGVFRILFLMLILKIITVVNKRVFHLIYF